MKKILLLFLFGICLQTNDAHAQYENDSSHTVPPFKIFDNLYYVGTDFVSAYILSTDNGLILIDALYGKFTDSIFPAMRSLGLDPMNIQLIICTHAHYDHMEGAEAIRKATGAHIYMTEADWQIVEGKLPDDYKSKISFPKRDRFYNDTDTFNFYGTKFYLFVTPGHTQGVTSILFPVKDGNKTYNAFMFGGVGLNFHGVKRTRQYLESVERIMKIPNIDVNISNHPEPGKILERAKLLASRKPGDPHPFVAPAEFKDWLRKLHRKAEQKLEEEKKLGNP